MTEIIAIANQKGGVGKTTTAINLAYALACLDQEVLAVDLDPQSNATSGLGVALEPHERTIYDILINNCSAAPAIKQTAMEWLDIIPSNHDLAGAEVELVEVANRETALKKALALLRGMYRFIIIDCPPSMGLLTINALCAADSVISPVQCEYYAMEGLAYFTDTAQKVKAFLNPRLKIDGGILTMFDARVNLSNQVREEVSKFYGSKIYNTAIPRNIRLAESPSFGQSIFTYDPSCRGAESYFDLAVEFLVRRGSDPALYKGFKPFAVDTAVNY
ncbi:MAG: AAA family ATPase, partial [Elusimicrobia bacterium]|nr:AAA family ATPase [Elusimicrobiota bacterium]